MLIFLTFIHDLSVAHFCWVWSFAFTLLTNSCNRHRCFLCLF